MIIDGIFKTFSFDPRIWKRKPYPLQSDEFVVALGLGLAPWLAVRDIIHPDANVWATAAVFATISILSLTAWGAAISFALNSWRKPRLREVQKFACLFCHLNFYVGFALLLQRFELLPDDYSPSSEFFDKPTAFRASLLFDSLHLALPAIIIICISWFSLQRDLNALRDLETVRQHQKRRLKAHVRQQQVAYWIVVAGLLVCTLFQMDLLLWRTLPNWVIPTLPTP